MLRWPNDCYLGDRKLAGHKIVDSRSSTRDFGLADFCAVAIKGKLLDLVLDITQLQQIVIQGSRAGHFRLSVDLNVSQIHKVLQVAEPTFQFAGQLAVEVPGINEGILQRGRQCCHCPLHEY